MDSYQKYRDEHKHLAQECADSPVWSMEMRNHTPARCGIAVPRWLEEFQQGVREDLLPSPAAWLVFEMMQLDLDLLSTLYVPSGIQWQSAFIERMARKDIQPVETYSELDQRFCLSDDAQAWILLAKVAGKEIRQWRHHGDPNEEWYDLAHILPDGTYTSLLPEGFSQELAFVGTEELFTFMHGPSLGKA